MENKSPPWWANLVTLAVVGVLGLGAVIIGALVVLPVNDTAGVSLIVGGSAMAFGSGAAARLRARIPRTKKED